MTHFMDRVWHYTRQTPVAIALTIGIATSGMATAKDFSIQKTEKIGKAIYEVVTNEAGDLVYITSTAPVERGGEGARILELDGKTLAVKREINVEEAPGYGISINNKTNTLYTSNPRSGGISAIDIKTGKIKKVILDPANPKSHSFKVLVDEDTNTIYVSIANRPSQLWIVDGNTNEIKKIINDVGNLATGLSLDKANKKLYISHRAGNEILVFDLNSQSMTGKFPSGGEAPMHQAFDPATGRLFVVNLTTGNLAVLDTKDNGKIIKTIPTGKAALSVAYDPKSKSIYVANRMDGNVVVVDSESYEVVSTLKTGTHPNTVVVNSKTGVAYVTNKAKANRNGPPVEDPEGDTVSILVAK